MKVVMQMTDMKKSEDVKKQFEGDFVMLVCLKNDGTRICVNSVVSGEEFEVFEVVRTLGRHMADVIMDLSEDREEMAEMSAEFCASTIKGVSKKYHEMKEKAE